MSKRSRRRYPVGLIPAATVDIVSRANIHRLTTLQNLDICFVRMTEIRGIADAARRNEDAGDGDHEAADLDAKDVAPEVVAQAVAADLDKIKDILGTAVEAISRCDEEARKREGREYALRVQLSVALFSQIDRRLHVLEGLLASTHVREGSLVEPETVRLTETEPLLENSSQQEEYELYDDSESSRSTSRS